MNYLGHAYLSFNQPEILVGNMISDFVKGRSRFDYPPGIQKGIALHREIDGFTDRHPATMMAKEFFRPHYRLYSGALMDVIYDHFIANDEAIFSTDTLSSFTGWVYQAIEDHAVYLPARFAFMFSYMKTENWLLHYRDTSGIEKSLRGLVRRAAYIDESETAYRIFLEHYEEIKLLSAPFIKDVKGFAKQKLDTLL